MLASKLAHERIHAYVIFEGMSIRGKQTLACVNNPPKKLIIGGKTKLLGFQRVGHESRHLRVTWFGHFIMPFGRQKC